MALSPTRRPAHGPGWRVARHPVGRRFPRALTPSRRPQRPPVSGVVGVTSPERFVTQREAARLAGVSKDSIIRARRAGRFANARRLGTQWEIPVDDLAAAGLLLPSEERLDAADPAPADLAEARVELARTQAKLAALEDLVARQDEELRFLRRLAADALAGKGTAP